MAWRPVSLADFWKRLQTQPQQVSKDLDDAIQRLALQAQDKVVFGTTTVTGASLNIATGLSVATGVIASIESSAALHEWVTVALGSVAGSISLYVWRNTGAADTTPLASITPRVIHWAARGSL